MSASPDALSVRRTHLARLPVVALVTAFNEEQTIGSVLDALQAAPSIDRVQVVDDGSTDRTRAIAEEKGAQVIALPTRIPVGAAILSHLPALHEECILLWCDADLVGLDSRHVETLLARFREGDVSQAMSCRGLPSRWPRAFRGAIARAMWTRVFAPLSGERAMLRSDFIRWIADARALGWRQMLRGYGIVLYLNWRAARDGRGNAVCYFDSLRQRYKHEKWRRSGLLEAIAQWAEFIWVYVKIRLFAPRDDQGREKSEKTIS
jgi:glycosyltransferase involved in cell wall biosynthesis